MNWSDAITGAVAGALGLFIANILLRWRGRASAPRTVAASVAISALWAVAWVVFELLEARFGRETMVGLIPAIAGLLVIVAIVTWLWRHRSMA